MKKYYIACRRKGGTIFSWLIRLFTFSKYSHCYLLLDKFRCVEADGFQDLNVLDMTPDRIEEYDFYELLPEYEKQCNYDKMYKYITNVLGTKYGYADLLAIAMSKLSGIWGKLLRKIYPKTEKQIICSEFISECYHEAGVCLFDSDEEWKCKLPTPKEISKSKKLRKLTQEEVNKIFE